MSEGIKHDQEKPRMDLLSSMWIEGVSNVLTFGARKYAAHNWRKGLERSRLMGACLRHVFAYLRGEDYDPETGLLHLYHASCCLMFASELHFTRPDTDDRYNDLSKIKVGDKNIHVGWIPKPPRRWRLWINQAGRVSGTELGNHPGIAKAILDSPEKCVYVSEDGVMTEKDETYPLSEFGVEKK